MYYSEMHGADKVKIIYLIRTSEVPLQCSVLEPFRSQLNHYKVCETVMIFVLLIHVMYLSVVIQYATEIS